MKKSTKGTVAAAAAAALLMGGMGTHAAWDAEGTVEGTDISSGHLKLVNASCGDWKLGSLVFDVVEDLLVPGDQLTRRCSFTVDAAGVNVSGTLAVTAPTFDGASGLTDELTASADFVDADGDPIDPVGATLSDGDVIDATITVTFTKASATNASQDLTGTLEDVAVTVTQS